ncbi:MAG: hypothetical protein CL848_02510 [Crocinitomicaceae bacterium]|nr:hypothetical protein [Crocinitomicaceae bacterium]
MMFENYIEITIKNKIKSNGFLFLFLTLYCSVVYSQITGPPTYDEKYNTYRVVAIKNINEQIVSISNTVSVEKPYTLYVPNAFSPDGDGNNDFFRVVAIGIKDFNIEIYNRWGQMIFKSNDLNDQWDGKFKNKLMPSGSYVYKIKTSDFSTQNEFLKSGTVALVR